MESLLKLLIEKEPKDIDNIVELRKRFIGRVIDFGGLQTIKFVKESDTVTGTIWVRYINRKRQCIRIEVTPKGRIHMIRYLVYINLQYYDGMSAPCGWYELEPISKKTANQISKDLISFENKYPENQNDELFRHLQILNIKPEQYIDNCIEKTICEEASYYYSNGQIATANILTYSLFKYSKNIEDEDLLGNISFLCGKLRMNREFYYAIHQLYDKKIDLKATTLTNIGSVVCDKLNFPEIALKFFIKALIVDPNLRQAQYNLWVATIRTMEKYIASKDYNKTIEIGNSMIDVAIEGDIHAFYSYLGLAYEGIGEKEKARNNYAIAISIKPNCVISNSGIKRINLDKYNSVELNQAINSIYRSIEYNGLIKF